MDTALDPLFAPLPDSAVVEITEALEAFRKLPNRYAFKNQDGTRMLDEKIQRAITLDPSGLTAALMLHKRGMELARDLQLSALEVMDMSDEDLATIRGLRQVTSLTKRPQIAEAVALFQARLTQAAEHYGFHSEKVAAIIADHEGIALIRTSALRCMQEFVTHQFNRGPVDPQRFQFNTWVQEFNSINSAIRVAALQPVNGVTLTMIRDPEIPEFSFFGFLFRIGENIGFITDKPDFDNPEQKFLRRNPGKDLDVRINSNFFPYGLLELEFNDKGVPYVAKDPSKGRLVTYQTAAIKLKEIKDLDPYEIVWTVLMFDLIRQRHWIENKQEAELSYTAEMMRVPDALHDGTALSIAQYQPLVAPALTHEDLTYAATRENFEVKPTEHNAWMETRYGHLVNEDVYAALSPVDQKAIVISTSEAGVELTPFSHPREGLAFWEEAKPAYRMGHLPAVSFGTKAELEKDFKWVARRNRASAITALANEEFDREYFRVRDWYLHRVRQNLPFLRRAIAAGTCKFRHLVTISTFEHGRGTEVKEREGLKIVERSNLRYYDEIGTGSQYISSGWSRTYQKHYCVDTEDIVATYAAKFRPETPECLAVLAGCKLTDLPDVLQHWHEEDPYVGNMILDDVDPMEWMCKNPWIPEQHRYPRGFRASVVVAFSKRALNRWKKGDVEHLPVEREIQDWVPALKVGSQLADHGNPRAARYTVLQLLEHSAVLSSTYDRSPTQVFFEDLSADYLKPR